MLPALLQKSLQGVSSEFSTANVVNLYELRLAQPTNSPFLLATFFFIDGVLICTIYHTVFCRSSVICSTSV